jgi:CubicO group peptidase (beta-lactamase class C family)
MKELPLKRLIACCFPAVLGLLINTAASADTDSMDAYIQGRMRELHIPGASLAVVEGGKIIHLRGFGAAYPDGKAPAPRTPFFIGSLTKSMTALAVMQLVEEGRIYLDAPVRRYLPWFRVADLQASAKITVRELLNQTSGLPESSGRIQLANFDNAPGATERQARALAGLKISRTVGSGFEYSNANYNLLGLIIEAASGETYADYLRRRLFVPLDMRHSGTPGPEGMAAGHRYWFSVPFAVEGLPVPYGSLPSGQLVSCSEDMAHYLIALLNGGRYGGAQILSQEGIDELLHGVAEDVQMGMSFGKYGMGWFIDEIGHAGIAWHTGIVPDFFSYMAILPQSKKGIVLLSNAYGYLMTPALTEMGMGAAALLAGRRPEPSQFGFLVWLQRGLLLIPLLQLLGVAATLRRLRRWRREPAERPGGRLRFVPHILLPLLFNIAVVLALIPMLGPMRGFWMLFMPDYSLIALVCGGFAFMWMFLRTGLVLRAFRNPSRAAPPA